MALHHGVQLTPEALGSVKEGDALASSMRVMRESGLRGAVQTGRKWKHLAALHGSYPVIAVQKDGTWLYVMNIVTASGGEVSVALINPQTEQAGVLHIPRAQFMAAWDGTLVTCKRKREGESDEEPFGLRWFLPDIMRHRTYFRDIAIAAIMSNMIAVVMPMLFQIILDKVVSHRSYQTLYVVLMVFVALILFDGLLNYVRQFLTLLVTNKISASLSSRIFKHLLGLPLQFFEATPAGVLMRHMGQTETVRNFLTGKLFFTALDVIFLPILLVMMSTYSGKLTIVVLAFSAAMAAVIGVMIPIYRYHLDRLYQAEGLRQSHLVETIHGMRTFKSLALEPSRVESWDNKVASLTHRLNTVGRVGATGNVLTNILEKSMTMAVLGFGTLDVFDGTLTIGALVAFNMISGRATGPLVQMVSLINEYQQTALALKMMGHVMNHPPERDTAIKGITPEITGAVEFDRVTFHYHGSATPALNQVSFKIEEGQVIGVVGRSGSGKTTVTRMIQSIHAPQDGLIRLNGTDIRNIDLPHLRRSIGVVLQDSFLYRGSIRENIAAARPDASLQEIIDCAKMAGAHEFIERLPFSYDTPVEENATNFSGGQRQRISIARALLSQPRLLIFDEATSALDPDSESIIQNNLKLIAHNRTMIIVSHRLSSLVQSDAILVLERGEVVDLAPHHVLLERCEIYRHLWHQQTQYSQ